MNDTCVGYATINGISSVTFTAMAPNPEPQSARLQYNSDVTFEKDRKGYDLAGRSVNLHSTVTWEFLLWGTSLANAQSSGIVITPLTKITISFCQVAAYNGDWLVESGVSYDIGNTKAATMSIPMRKYADATQNSTMTTPVTNP